MIHRTSVDGLPLPGVSVRAAACAIDAVRTLLVLQDAEVPIIGPARKGERREIHLNVFYMLLDERISAINPNVISVQQAE